MNQPSWSQLNPYATGGEVKAPNQTVEEMLFGVTDRDVNLYLNEKRMSERQVLDLASILVKWGYICMHVCPQRIKKGPIVLCSDCNRLVVEEERD